jgi:hypothetical protein
MNKHTKLHSGWESAANRRPFWLWIYYLGKWKKKEEGRRRDGGGCSTVVNRLSVPRPLARRASHLRLPTSTRSPPCSCRCVSLTFLVLWIRNHLVIFVLCSPSTEPIFVLILTHPPTHPPRPIHHISLHNISFYLFIYLSIYPLLLSRACFESSCWQLPIFTKPKPTFKSTSSHELFLFPKSHCKA